MSYRVDIYDDGTYSVVFDDDTVLVERASSDEPLRDARRLIRRHHAERQPPQVVRTEDYTDEDVSEWGDRDELEG